MTSNIPQKRRKTNVVNLIIMHSIIMFLKCLAAVFFLAHLVVEELGP